MGGAHEPIVEYDTTLFNEIAITLNNPLCRPHACPFPPLNPNHDTFQVMALSSPALSDRDPEANQKKKKEKPSRARVEKRLTKRMSLGPFQPQREEQGSIRGD